MQCIHTCTLYVHAHMHTHSYILIVLLLYYALPFQRKGQIKEMKVQKVLLILVFASSLMDSKVSCTLNLACSTDNSHNGLHHTAHEFWEALVLLKVSLFIEALLKPFKFADHCMVTEE